LLILKRHKYENRERQIILLKKKVLEFNEDDAKETILSKLEKLEVKQKDVEKKVDMRLESQALKLDELVRGNLENKKLSLKIINKLNNGGVDN
jgi:hypothetical protein